MTRRIRVVVACVVTLFCGLQVKRLYFSPTEADILAQLTHLRAALDDGAASRMQSLFPEGYLFTHVLYGLTWVDRGLSVGPEHPRRAQALDEARAALKHAESNQAKAPFPIGLSPPYGIFYAGWTNLLRGGVVALQPDNKRNPADVAALKTASSTIAAAFGGSATPFLRAYQRRAWPCDSVVAIASLALHDQLFKPRFKPVIQRWQRDATQRLDPRTALLPHEVHFATGAGIDGTRATSQAIITTMLPLIDRSMASDHYRRFVDQFLVSRLGFPGFREYPSGVAGGSDVDSGPLIFGVSMSATVVAAGAAQVNGDQGLADALHGTMEFFGLPIHWAGSKRYGFGVLPVGDAFVAWSERPVLGFGSSVQPSAPTSRPGWWRGPALLFLAVFSGWSWIRVRSTDAARAP